MTRYALPFQLEPQQDSLLCWAAVAVSLRHFYDPQQTISQAEFAHSVFGEKFNRVCDPNVALTKIGIAIREIEGALSLTDIEQQLQSGNPVIACMKYFVGWHLVVIYGVAENQELLVDDPLNGQSTWALDVFSDAYKQYYYWTHSYLIKSVTAR